MADISDQISFSTIILLHKRCGWDMPKLITIPCRCLQNRVIQESGVHSAVPAYVVGVFSGDQMIAEGTKQIAFLFL